MTAQEWDDEPVREDDFLAFWDAHHAQATRESRRILGVDVRVPTELPMAIIDEAERLMQSTNLADVERVVAMLFGPDIFQTWKAHGITVGMLSVLMTWGMANAAGKPTTFEEAAVLAKEAEAAGKAAAAQAAKASLRTVPSGSTGRSSSPTSGASTASPRKKSPR